MESKDQRPPKNTGLYRSIITVALIDALLAAIAWIINWPSFDEAILLLLGIVILFAGVIIQSLFFGGGDATNEMLVKQMKDYHLGKPMFQWLTSYREAEAAVGGVPGSDLEKMKR